MVKTGKDVSLCTCIKCYLMSHAWHRQLKVHCFCPVILKGRKAKYHFFVLLRVMYNSRTKRTLLSIVYSRQLHYRLNGTLCSFTETQGNLYFCIKCLYGTFWSMLVLSCHVMTHPHIYTHTWWDENVYMSGFAALCCCCLLALEVVFLRQASACL